MEGGGDSSSSQNCESILPDGNVSRTNIPEVNKSGDGLVKEHVEGDVNEEGVEDISDEDTRDATKPDERGDEEMSNDENNDNEGRIGHEPGLQNIPQDDGGNDSMPLDNSNIIQQANVTDHEVAIATDGSLEVQHVDVSELLSSCTQNVTNSSPSSDPHSISLPANISASTQSRYDSDNSRTTCATPHANDEQPYQLPDAQEGVTNSATLDLVSDNSNREAEASVVKQETETPTCSKNVVTYSNPSTFTDYSSPEAILLSIAKSISDDSQQEKATPTLSKVGTGTTIPGSKASNAANAVMVSQQGQSTVELGGTQEVNEGQLNESSTKRDTTVPTSAAGRSLPVEVASLENKRLQAVCLDQDDDLLSELDAELDEFLIPQDIADDDPLNGLLKRGVILEELPQFKVMRAKSEELQREVDRLRGKINSMQERLSDQQHHIAGLEQERESLQGRVQQAASVEGVHLLRIKELDVIIDQLKVELAAGKERQLSHDAAAKKAITQLQQEMILRVDQVKSMYEEAIKEKEAIVIKYAKSEKEVLDQKKLREALEKKYKELNLTAESLKTQLHETKKDRTKMKNTAASKETEASYLQKEIEQLKEEVSSQGIKVKWAQNKLKTELDAHKETKLKLAKTEQRLMEAKEETEQIRKNCQEMIKTYQTSEEVKSNSLDKQLKVKHSELEQKEQEQREHLEVHQARLRELESLKKSLADNLAELDSYKVKNKCLEDERLQNEDLLAKFKELLNSQKEENRRLNKQLEEKKLLAQQLEDLKQTEMQLRSEVSGQKVDQSDLEMELEASRQKETELLQFTEKITARNTTLSSENAALQSKANNLELVVQKLQQDLDELQSGYSQLSAELKQERQYRERESSLLTTKLKEKSRAVEQLSIQLDEARDDNKTLKRKHVANTKDLTRQLQQAHKRLESLESTDNAPRDNISVGSRTSSSGSLDTLPGSVPSAVNSSGSSVSVTTSTSSKPEEHSVPQDHTVAIATGNDYPGVDKGMLVDRIVRLQKAHQRKNEKIEFMQEHVTHLVDELKKKSKIIQQYIMRDEAGALVPVSSDINKAQMSKQGGIMSSLYRSQSTDPTMTLDLSLEINRKLQAVLEDTLLKNMTLKENIETLGQEIARLLKEQQKQSGHQQAQR